MPDSAQPRYLSDLSSPMGRRISVCVVSGGVGGWGPASNEGLCLCAQLAAAAGVDRHLDVIRFECMSIVGSSSMMDAHAES